MRKTDLIKLVREVIDEVSVTGSGASFTAGQGEQYATPHAFGKGSADSRATKTLKKLGYSKTQRPKRPSHTKLFDYLDEELN